MKIVYATSPEALKRLSSSDLFVVFVPDTYGSSSSRSWDDFGYKTTCKVYIIDREEVSYLGYAKMLLEDATNTHEKIKELMGNSKYIAFEKIGCDFLTLADGRGFYAKLKKKISAELIPYFRQARDAGYVKMYDQSDLFDSDGFGDSLLREMGGEEGVWICKEKFWIL